MKNMQIRKLTELGVALALATILNFLKLYEMPQGGSVTLEMIPIIFIALRWGWKEGAFLGSTYGLLQLLLGASIYYPLQAVLDYPLAYGLVGLAGLVSNLFSKGSFKVRSILIAMATVLGASFRFLAHVISGVVFFGEYAPEGIDVWVYSLGYNATYMIPQIIITIIAMALLSKGLENTSLATINKIQEVE
ncbi:energy-coupled thiamine transporter ThiT [Orenia metallireducens]|jgi:thiamine transporter|nr:energy-coupled thiamine transporter ThiT [Orenia metallireducens]